MILGVDVDLTVVQSDAGWFDWNNHLSDKADRMTMEQALERNNGVLPYNIAYLYPKIDLEKSYDYWRRSDLYDSMVPMKDSVEVLHMLSTIGYKIVFVSALKGDHHKSKVNFLKRHFPFMDGFIGTKEKQFAKVDALIDDRNKNLNNLGSEVMPILFKTPYEQEVELVNNIRQFSSWEKIWNVMN